MVLILYHVATQISICRVMLSSSVLVWHWFGELHLDLLCYSCWWSLPNCIMGTHLMNTWTMHHYIHTLTYIHRSLSAYSLVGCASPPTFSRNLPCFMIYRSPKVLLRWLLENSDIKICLSFPREGTHPSLTPAPLDCQGTPLVQLFVLFPPQKFWPR